MRVLRHKYRKIPIFRAPSVNFETRDWLSNDFSPASCEEGIKVSPSRVPLLSSHTLHRFKTKTLVLHDHVLLFSVFKKAVPTSCMCASPQKWPFYSAMTSVFCGTRKSSAVAAWRFANWPRAIYKSLVFSCTSTPHIHTSSFQDLKRRNACLPPLSSRKERGSRSCARPAEKHPDVFHVEHFRP